MADKTKNRPLLSVPDKADKRAAALRENLKRRKESAKNNTEKKDDKKDK